MAVHPSEELTFEEGDLADAVMVIDQLTEANAGWVNFVPEVEPGYEPPARNPIVSVFSARGDAVPMATWFAPKAAGGRATLGIEHGSGPRALVRLTEVDLGLGPDWLKVSDHARKGLVVTTPRGAEPESSLWWLLTAAHALSTVPLTGSWLARVYRG